MAQEPSLGLLLVYRELFDSDFLKQNINLKSGSWQNDLKVLIDDETCLANIGRALDRNQSFELFSAYLRQANELWKYKMFIYIWKKVDGAKATQFEMNLMKKIQETGHSEEDSTFKAVPPGNTGYILVLYIYA